MPSAGAITMTSTASAPFSAVNGTGHFALAAFPLDLPAPDAEPFALHQGLGHGLSRALKYAGESRTTHAHALGRRLLIETLKINQAHGFQAIESQFGGFQLRAGNRLGLENPLFEMVCDASLMLGSGHEIS